MGFLGLPSWGDIKQWVRDEINKIVSGLKSAWDWVEDLVSDMIAKAMAWLGWPTTNYYVTWDWFETICVTDGLSSIGENYDAGALEAAGLQADDRFTSNVWRLDSSYVVLGRPKSNFCSVNPWVCLLPGMYHWDVAGVAPGETNTRFDTDIKDADGLEALPKWDGNVKDILLNTRYIWDCYVDSDTIADFVMKVAAGVNDACGGYWDLKLVEDPYDPSRLMVVDLKAVENSDAAAPVLDLGGVQSIARSWGTSTDIPDDLKHSIMMGTNQTDDGVQNTHEPTKVWQVYGQGVTDLMYEGIHPDKNCNKDSTSTENTDCSGEEGEKSDLLEDFKTACLDLLDNVGDEEIDSCKTAMRAYWSERQTETRAEQQVVIPIGFNGVFDGIGSLRWGMGFSVKQINEAFLLPKGHRFMVTNVSQEISATDWTTSIDTQLVLPNTVTTAEFNDSLNPASKTPAKAEEAPTNVQTRNEEPIEIVENENAENPELKFKIPTAGGWTVRSDSGGDGRWLAPRGSRQHKGIDLASRVGDQIMAPMDGKVLRTAAQTGGMPGTKIVGTGDYEGYLAYMFYVEPNAGMVNKTVKKGDVVATQGDLSVDYPENVGDHVHVSIRKTAPGATKGSEKLDPTLGSGDINWEA